MSQLTLINELFGVGIWTCIFQSDLNDPSPNLNIEPDVLGFNQMYISLQHAFAWRKHITDLWEQVYIYMSHEMCNYFPLSSFSPDFLLKQICRITFLYSGLYYLCFTYSSVLRDTPGNCNPC